MNAPRVGIVLATNRLSPYLEAAVRSVHEQAFQSWGLLVVDNGCPEPEQLCALLSEYPRVTLLNSSPRGNVSAARNLGLSRTKAEFVTFIDDDDLWDPSRLELSVAALDRNPSAAGCYSAINIIDGQGTLIGPGGQRAADIHEVVRRDAGVLLGNVVIRRDVLIRAGGFHSALSLAEDLDLILRVAMLGQLVFIDAPLMSYRTYDGNTTRHHRDLTVAIREILRLHRSAAYRDPRGLVHDFDVSLRKNRRFAGWSAWRETKRAFAGHDYAKALSELAWAASFAPDLPFLVVANRLRTQFRARRRPSSQGRRT